MTYLHACQTCRLKGQPCAARDRILTAVRGLGVGSVKHRCADHIPMFAPGDPVEVLTVAWLSSQHPEDDAEPPRHWYPGHFLRYAYGGRPLVHVAKGALPIQGIDQFEPNSNGVLKVPRQRVRPREGATLCVDECQNCGAITSIGQPCGRDPEWHSLSRCQAALLTALANKEAPNE